MKYNFRKEMRVIPAIQHKIFVKFSLTVSDQPALRDITVCQGPDLEGLLCIIPDVITY